VRASGTRDHRPLQIHARVQDIHSKNVRGRRPERAISSCGPHNSGKPWQSSSRAVPHSIPISQRIQQKSSATSRLDRHHLCRDGRQRGRRRVAWAVQCDLRFGVTILPSSRAQNNTGLGRNWSHEETATRWRRLYKVQRKRTQKYVGRRVRGLVQTTQ